MKRVALGLGTNIGDRLANLREALELLSPVLKKQEHSAIYESAALLPEEADPAWNLPFLNMAVAGYTALTPYQMLTKAKEIERKMGRRQRGRWAPREIDIDILTWEDLILRDTILMIPHLHLLNRAFVLVPLAEVDPYWTYPINGEHFGKTAQELAEEIGARDMLATQKTNHILFP